LEFWQQFKQVLWGVAQERKFQAKVVSNLPKKYEKKYSNSPQLHRGQVLTALEGAPDI